MITVRIRMHGALRRLLPDACGEGALSLEPEASVADLLRALGATDEVWLIAVDGAVARRTQPLRDGACVDLYPPMEGG